MKVGDEIWFFVNKGNYVKRKCLMRGILIMKNTPYWRIKSNKKIYRRKQSEIALINKNDKKLFLI